MLLVSVITVSGFRLAVVSRRRRRIYHYRHLIGLHRDAGPNRFFQRLISIELGGRHFTTIPLNSRFDSFRHQTFTRIVGVQFGHRAGTNSFRFANTFVNDDGTINGHHFRLVSGPRQFIVIGFTHNASGPHLLKILYRSGPQVGDGTIATRTETELGGVGTEIAVHRTGRFPSIGPLVNAGRQRFVDGDSVRVTRTIFNRLARFHHPQIDSSALAFRRGFMRFTNTNQAGQHRAAGRTVIFGRLSRGLTQWRTFQTMDGISIHLLTRLL